MNPIFSGNFQNRNLGPYAWDAISTIYYVPDTLDPTLSYNLGCEDAEVFLEDSGLICSTPLSDYDDRHLLPPGHPVIGDFL